MSFLLPLFFFLGSPFFLFFFLESESRLRFFFFLVSELSLDVELEESLDEESVELEELVEDEEEWYRTSVARISGSQALSLLHQYLQKITVDRFTRLTPAWTLKVLPFNTFTDTDFMVYYSEKKRVK